MTLYQPIADAPVDAFQWNGDPLSGYDLPPWAAGSAHVEAPGSGVLEVTCHDGRSNARPSDWVVQYADGSIDIVPDMRFRLYYDVDAVDKKAKAAHAASVKAEAKANTKA